jgi:hypothetical protein
MGIYQRHYAPDRVGTTHNETMAGTNWDETLSGLSGYDMLKGLGGRDALDGGSGEDKIIGGGGQDKLTGGNGADIFVFALGDSAASKPRAATILDMQVHKGDLIDLHLINANEATSGNQKFVFIGTDTFSGHAGELRYETTAKDTYIYGDTDGDKKVDFVIHLDDAMNLKGDYFVL